MTCEPPFTKSLYCSWIGYHRATACRALAHHLRQCASPGSFFLPMQQAAPKRVTLERETAQIVGKIGKPSHLFTQQELGNDTALAGSLGILFQVSKLCLHMRQA